MAFQIQVVAELTVYRLYRSSENVWIHQMAPGYLRLHNFGYGFDQISAAISMLSS